ncbi:hypothetical protein L9F63_000104, partial [Diploptera punctata]
IGERCNNNSHLYKEIIKDREALGSTLSLNVNDKINNYVIFEEVEGLIGSPPDDADKAVCVESPPSNELHT